MATTTSRTAPRRTQRERSETTIAELFTINYAGFRVYEEPDLERRFGEDYRAYKRNVPRWLPRRTPWVPPQP